MALLSVTNDKGFQNLLQTNVLYFVLKPNFQKKKVFTLTQAMKSSLLNNNNIKILNIFFGESADQIHILF